MSVTDSNSSNVPKKIPQRPKYRVQGDQASYIRPEGIKGISPNWTQDIYDPKTGATLSKYNEISRNPVVKLAIDLRITGAMSSGWDIKVQNDYDLYPQFEVLDREIIRSIQDQFNDLDDTFNNKLREMLYMGIVYGPTFAEKSYRYTLAGGWELTRLKILPSYQFDIYTTDFNEINKLYHLQTGIFVEEDELDKFIIGAYPYELLANRYGRSELQSIYNDVKVLEILEQFRARAIQLLASKTVVHYGVLERDEGVLNQVTNSINNLEAFSVIHLPLTQDPNNPSAAGIKDDLIEVLEDRASSEGLQHMQAAIEFYVKRILNCMGIPDDLGYVTTPLGSRAKAESEERMIDNIRQQDQEYLEALINTQLIKSMVDYNYRNLPDRYVYPRFEFMKVEVDDHEMQIAGLEKLITLGIINPQEKWIRDSLELPTDDENATESTEPIQSFSNKPEKEKKSFWKGFIKRFIRQ